MMAKEPGIHMIYGDGEWRPVTNDDILEGGGSVTTHVEYLADVSRDDPPVNLGVPDEPGVAFIAALDVMRRTMLKHMDAVAIVAALPQDERDEMTAGVPIYAMTLWMDLIQRTILEARDGN